MHTKYKTGSCAAKP